MGFTRRARGRARGGRGEGARRARGGRWEGAGRALRALRARRGRGGSRQRKGQVPREFASEVFQSAPELCVKVASFS